jgi:hypothetical protein
MVLIFANYPVASPHSSSDRICEFKENFIHRLAFVDRAELSPVLEVESHCFVDVTIKASIARYPHRLSTGINFT